MKDTDFFKNQKPEKTIIPGLILNAPVVPKTTVGEIGLELEIEGRNLVGGFDLGSLKGPDTNTVWTTHQDGSLRGEALEYVFNTPCSERDLASLVNGLYDSFNTNKTKLTLSNRCSTHVHINMQGAKINELTSVLALWMTFEEALIAWNGEERINNHFCLSGSQTRNVSTAWREYLSGDGAPNQEGLKYSSLNVLTLWRFGSFEFRVGRGAESPEYVITWAKFLNRFCNYARKVFVNPQLIGSGLSEQTGSELFRNIVENIDMVEFGEEVIKNFGGEAEFNESCLKGFRNAQPFVGLFPWNDWLYEINKEYIPNPFTETKVKHYNRAIFGGVDPGMPVTFEEELDRLRIRNT